MIRGGVMVFLDIDNSKITQIFLKKRFKVKPINFEF